MGILAFLLHTCPCRNTHSAGDPALLKPHSGALFVVRGLRSHKDGERVFGYPGREVDPETVDK